jgi:thiol-disulfide isomerase/thioredoxin
VKTGIDNAGKFLHCKNISCYNIFYLNLGWVIMKTKVVFVTFVSVLFCSLFVGTAYPAGPDNTFAFPFTFSTEDIYGRKVTEKSLGEKEVFFVHYLATWCPPCVREMPDVATIAKKYGDRVGFIGLLDDFDDNKAAAIRLVERTGITFIMIDAEHSELSKLLQMLQSGYVPTSILIGRNGNIIGEQIIGAYGLKYADFIDRAIGTPAR